MITAPSAFRDALGAGNRNYQVLATVTLTSGSVLTLDNSVIWASGFSFEDAISTSADTLDIGAAIINQATLVISNMDEQFSDYDFDGATVAVQIGLRPDEESSVSYINKGTFTVGKTAYNGTLITLTCLDNMSKFDKAYASPLTFPTTAITVVQDACQACGVTLAVSSFDGDTTSIPEPPAEAVTYRQMLVWIGQMVGCCWRINNVGELAPVWYNISVLDQFYADGGTFAYDNGDEYDGGTFAYNDGDSIDGGTFAQQAAYFSIHSASSESVAVDDTIVTGIKIIVSNTAEDAATAVSEYTTGTDGYVLTIEGNPLINADNVSAILSALGSRLIGMTYRKGMVSHINDPRLEAGDVFVFTDHKGHVYPMICSETSFTVGEYQHTTSASETPARNSAQRYSESTKNTVKIFEAVGREKNARETAVEDLQDQIDSAPGLYMTTQTEAGATVYLLHNKPTVAASNIIWKMSSAAVGVSTNGGQSYNAGLTADGTAIVQRLYANAVTAGILKSADYQPPAPGSNYSTRGMIVDLNSQVIRTPKTAILSDGSIYSSSVDLTGKITATSGKIGGWEIDNYALLYSRTVEITGGTLQEYTNLDYYSVTGFTAKHTSSYEQSGYNLFSSGVAELYTIDAHYDYAPRLDVYQQFGTRKRGTEVNAGGVRFYDIGGTSEYNFTLTKDVKNTVTNITRSGTTFTATRLDGTTFTFTQQDNNSVTGVKGNAESSYRTGNINLTPANIGALALIGGTLSGSVAISATGKGFNLTDASGTTYGGIYDNGDNLWIGAAGSTSPHHRGSSGNTYISAGYNTTNSAGNGTIYISVPSLSGSTWSHTTYGVLHTGNYSSYALPKSGGTLTGNITIGQTTDTVSRGVTSRNSLGNVGLTVGSDGSHGLYSGTKGGFLLYATKDANSTNSTLYIPRPLTVSGLASVGNNVIATASDTSERYFRAVNSNGSIELNASSGNKGVYDRSGGRWIIYLATNSTADTAVTIPRALTVTGTLTGYDYSGASHVMVGSAADTSHRVGYLYHQNPTTVRVYGQAGGSVYTTYTTLTGTSSSDIRLKRNVADTEIADALSVINQIEMKSFDWLPGWRDYTHQPIGMIADQIEKLDSRLVIGGGYDPDGEPNYKVIDDHYLICYLTKAVQELSAEIKTLKGAA